MEEEYECGKCGAELTVTRTRVDEPSDENDLPHEIVSFYCSSCDNGFKARSPPHPRRQKI